MVTIRDIAKKAGVHVSTVSRALNDSSRVKYETKQYIKKVAKEMNYMPHELARGLAGKSTNTIGVIVPELINAFYAEIMNGIESSLEKKGYSIIFGKSDFKLEKEQKYIELFNRKKVDGIIVSSMTLDTLEKIETLDVNKVPFVLIDSCHTREDIDSINIDNEYGVYNAVDYLIKTGHKKIAFVGDQVTNEDRLKGYKKALKDHDIQIDENLVKIGTERFEMGGYNSVRQMLESGNKPDSIFAVNDHMAIGTIKAITDKGLKIPQDISVIGFDDITISNYLELPLTTVVQPKLEIGELASKLILERIENKDKPAVQHIVLKPKLVIRSTTKNIIY